MKSTHKWFLLWVLLFLVPLAHAQLWNGVIAPSRATDWTHAGIPTYGLAGTTPSDGWTQCGSTIAAFGSSGSYAAPTTITNAINHTSSGYTGCAANTYVKLGVGDFYLNSGMCLKIQNNELRGSGPTHTRLHFNNTIICQGGGAQVSIGFEDAGGESPCCGTTGSTAWTAGYAQGATSVTVANASTLGITANQTVLGMDQCDTGYSGATTGGSYSNTCGSGSSVDNGNFYSANAAYVPSAHSGGTCTVSGTGITGTGFSAAFGGVINLTISGVTTSVPFTFSSSTTGTIGQRVNSSGTFSSVSNGSYACSFPTGNSYNASNGAVARNHRFQEEFATITGCSPNCTNAGSTVLTISAPLIHPNWTSGQNPEVWSIQAYRNFGIRDLTVDATGTGANPGVDFNNVASCWAHNIVVENTESQGIGLYGVANCDVDSNYVYNSGSSVLGTDPNSHDASGIDINGSGILVTNNIIQWSRIGIIPNGPASGNVIAYNLVINAFESNGDMWGALYDGHQNGTDYNLWESNVATQAYQDQTHGGKLAETWFRNFITGWQSCSNGNCSPNASAVNANVFAMAILSSNRYDNVVGNVLGTPGITSVYTYTQPDQFSGTSTGYVYDYASGNGCSPTSCVGGPIPIDPIVPLTTYKWGNWDAFNAATQWNTAEVPSGISVYPQSVPTASCTASLSCPASFYFASRPSWYAASIAFPAIGPDVTSGNVGQCSGTPNVSGKFALLPATLTSQCGSGNTKTTAWGGHANAIPAVTCYLAVGGTLDGVTSLLTSFDANTCYSSSLTGTSTSLTASNSTPVVGTNITLTGSVTPSSGPTGTITFLDGGTSLGTFGPLSGGSVIHTVVAITAGVHSYTAVYNGDSTYASSASTAVVVTTSSTGGSLQTPGGAFTAGVVIQ